jgi:CcmD family protein
MNKKLLRLLFTTIVLISGFMATGQTTDSTSLKKPEMADVMRSNGKIYVVVTVVIIILTGLIVYVVRLDRKISKLEKKI